MNFTKETNRGAMLRAAHRLMVDAQTYIQCAGNLTRLAGGGEDELIEVANAFVHTRRALVKLSELAQLFPRESAPPAEPAKAAP